MVYSFSRGQVAGLLLASIAIGINTAVVMALASDGNWSRVALVSATVLAMIVAIVALLRIGRLSASRTTDSRST